MIFNRLVTLCMICSPLSTNLAGHTLLNQQSTEEKEEQENRKARQKETLALLYEIVAEAQSFRLAENRIRIQSKTADLLWALDKRRALALFGEASRSLEELTANVDGEDPQQYSNRVNSATQLRQEMLAVVSRWDPSLARKFLAATRQTASGVESSSSVQPNNELRMELSIATQLAPSDPIEAVKIAEKCLDKGVSTDLINLVYQLQSSDKEAASSFAQEIAQKLRSENMAASQEATGVAIGLLQMGPPQAAASNQVSNQGPTTNSSGVLDETTYRELMDKLAVTALQMSIRNNPSDWRERNNAQFLFMSLESMMDQIEKYAPAQAPSLHRKIAEFDKTLDPQTQVLNEYHRQEQSGTVDHLLDLAAQAPAEMRDSLYQQVAWKALNQGETDRARQIINENISTPFERQQQLANLERQVLWQASNQGNLDEALRRVQALSSVGERASTLAQLATNAAGRGDGRTALQLLDQAHELLNSRAEDAVQLSAQLQIASAFVSLQASKSFQILEAVADQLNELSAAAAALAGFDGQQYFKEGEMVLQQGGLFANLFQEYGNTLGSVAQKDFERAKLAAERLQRPEARVTAQLSVAQAALQ